MLKTTLKNLAARRLRLLTTGLAVLLGVAFMAGTLVLTDTIQKTFDDLFADVNAGTDAYVRSSSTVEGDFGEQRARVDASLVEQIQLVEGVAAADGSVQGYARIIDKEGDAIGDPSTGAPTFGADWTTIPELKSFNLVEGREPEADDEIVIDKASADEADYRPGDRAQVITEAGVLDVTVVGIAKFGDSDSPAGASFALFTEEAAQRAIAEPGKFDAIQVVGEEGVSEDVLRDRIAAVMPDGIEVLTGAEITKENQDDIQESLSFFNIFLLIFAFVAVFVGAYIIYNTFSIIVAQRTREMALMRAIGASRRQVLLSVLLEAVIIGLIASVLGLVAGIGVAGLLKSLLAAFGIDIPAGGLVLKPRTVVISILVGLLVSMVSALFPARRASKVPPVAAMRDVSLDTSAYSRVRLIAGVVVLALGVLSLASGLLGGGGGAGAAVGAGVVLTFVGVSILGPVIARPVSGVIGAPLPRLRGVTGTIARENAMRNPKRTSATAAALMIGVGLVAFITIFASSTKESVKSAIDDAFVGDFVVDSGTFGFGGLPPELSRQLNELPEVDAATGIRFGFTNIEGTDEPLFVIDPATAEGVFDLGVTEGSIADLDEDGVLVLDTTAEDNGLAVGDRLRARFAETGEQEIEVAGIYTEGELTEGFISATYVAGTPLYEANVADQFDAQIYVKKAGGVSLEQARTAIERVTDEFPTAELQDRKEFEQSFGEQIDRILNLIYALLMLAIVIALLGIANTLALSILERTRELGLLRAVGMTQAQLRSSVRWESVIIALLGAVLGLGIGLFFGWAMVTALEDEGINVLRIPWDELVFIAIGAAVAGVLAGILPARRAARMDVLRAVTTE